MEERIVRNIGTMEHEFLSAGGKMGQLIREYDWSKTELGDPSRWPQSLRSTLSICLNSNFPIAIYWGNELTLLYNDAWSPIPGNKHSWALGKTAREVWPEIWDVIEPQFSKAFNGEPGGSTDAFLPMYRHGYTEECYFNFTFTPIYGEGGKVEGVFNAVIETTKTVLNERQSQTLRELGNLDRTAKTLDEVLTSAARVLEKNNKDFPFGIIYKINEKEHTADSLSYVGLNNDPTVFPPSIDLTTPTSDTENFYTAYTTNAIIISENNGRRIGLPKGGWDMEANYFIHLPIANQNRKAPVAIFSAALNPYRQFDASYRQFAQLVADQISTEVSNALAYEEERKRAEALAEIDKAKTIFFTNISHEFRTPLTLMLGSLEELLNKKTEEIGRENKEAIEISHRNAVRMLRLVNNLLDFSRIEAGRVKARFQLTDISKYTTELASNFRPVVEKGGLQFNVLCDDIVKPIYVDKEMWEKIVLNLLSNAFKYTLSGNISISLSAENDRVVLQVIDTGIGIPEDELPKMFQRFHRAENATGRTYEGTGIGLSLVKELVQLHGGEITVNSKVGQGTVFTVSIPTGKHHLPPENISEKETDFAVALSDAFIEEAQSLISGSTSETEESTSMHASTILVVDDNPDMRSHIKTILQKSYNVVTAGNGMDALLKMKDHPFDAVVSDVMMPVMDGLELLQRIKETTQTSMLPVILVSARAGDEAWIEGFDVGADDYLVKPFSAKELLARVHSQISIAHRRNKALNNIYRLFDEVPFAVAALKGPELIIEYINQYNLAIWRQAKEDVLGKPLFEARPDLRQSAESVHEQVFQTGRRYQTIEMAVQILVNGNEETRYFNTTIDPMTDDDGKITGQLVASLDVTDLVVARKKIEESEKKVRLLNEDLERRVEMRTSELKQSEERFHKMVDEVEDYAIVLLDKNGFVVNWNKGAEKIKGYEEEDILGKHFEIFYLPEDRENQVPQKILHEATIKGKAAIEGWRLRKDGSKFWGSIVITALHNEREGIIGFTKVTRDLTERKMAEDRLREYSAELEFRNKELEQFAYAASHDMKEPLRKINLYGAFIRDNKANILDSRSADYLERSLNAAGRMGKLIDDLLAYSRTSQTSESLVPVDMNAIVEEVVSEYIDEIAHKDINVSVGALPTVTGIPFQLKQLMLNLVGNAIKYSDKSKKSSIKIDADIIKASEASLFKLPANRLYYRICVEDNGVGFEQEYAGKIFEMFQRLQNKEEAKGSGIGLAICKKIVQNHKGHISAAGRLNEGARFDIYLPAK